MSYQRGSLKQMRSQGRRNLGAALPGYKSRTASELSTASPSARTGFSRKRRMHGGKSIGSDCWSASMMNPTDGRIHFDALAEHYLKADFGADAVRPKSDNTKAITEPHHPRLLVEALGQ